MIDGTETSPQRCGYGRLIYFIDHDIEDGVHNINYADIDGDQININEEVVSLIQEGQWENGKLHGYGRSIDFRGNLYLGQYKNGLKEGNGVYMWVSGNIYEGCWKNDKQFGKGAFYYADSKESFVGLWQDG